MERAAAGRSKAASISTTQGEANKESRVDATRIDANDIIDKLFEDTNIESLKPDDSAESKGCRREAGHFQINYTGYLLYVRVTLC